MGGVGRRPVARSAVQASRIQVLFTAAALVAVFFADLSERCFNKTVAIEQFYIILNDNNRFVTCP
jgi:hypothetical protein